jgi:branched-chain amino acid transport system permease protein
MIAAVLLLPVLFLEQPYQLSILIYTLLNVMLAVSMRLIMITGQITLGHAAFAAIGGYTSALLVTKLGFTFWEALIPALALSAAISLVIGYPTLRIKGAYFAILTFAFSEVIRYVFQTWKDIFGGAFGIVDIPRPEAITIPGLFAIDFSSRISSYYLIAVFVIVAILFMYRLEKSRFGLIFHSIGDADTLSEHSGVNIMNYKVLAFTIGSIFASLAGILYTHYIGVITPWSFTFNTTVNYLIFVVFGGMGSFIGPIIGACIFTPLPQILKPLKTFEPLISSVVLLIVILFLPGGLMSFFKRRDSGNAHS